MRRWIAPGFVCRSRIPRNATKKAVGRLPAASSRCNLGHKSNKRKEIIAHAVTERKQIAGLQASQASPTRRRSCASQAFLLLTAWPTAARSSGLRTAHFDPGVLATAEVCVRQKSIEPKEAQPESPPGRGEIPGVLLQTEPARRWVERRSTNQRHTAEARRRTRRT